MRPLILILSFPYSVPTIYRMMPATTYTFPSQSRRLAQLHHWFCKVELHHEVVTHIFGILQHFLTVLVAPIVTDGEARHSEGNLDKRKEVKNIVSRGITVLI